MNESKETYGSHEFNVQGLVEVKPEVVQAAKKAITMVWDKHVSQPESFKVIFCKFIFDPKTGEDTGASCSYDPDIDTFIFALDTIDKRMKFGLPDGERMVILAAHEATHKWQIHRGDKIRPSPKTPEMDELYYDDKHEAEAWDEAVNVFKALYPNSSGSFANGKKRYQIPEKSKY